jgi:hypothetical protein
MQEHSNITPYTQKKYMGAIRKISNDLIRQNLYINSLTDLMIQKDPEEIMKVYFEVPENSQANERGHRTYSAAFRKLIEFHKYHKKKND